MRTEADLRGAAAAHGLSVTALERVPMPGDPSSTTLATRMTFDDPWAAARLLYELAQEDAADPVVRAWALDLQAAASRWLGEPIGSPTRSSALVDELARTIHGNVQEQILFIHEPKETFQSARVTMATQAGDCDDHARLVYALARAAGLKAKLIFLEDDAQPVHVVAQIEDSRGYQWAETTIDAEYGEPPLQAYARLKQDVARGLAADPFAKNGMGFLAIVTPGDVLAFRKTWDPYVTGVAKAAVACADEQDAKVAGSGDDRRLDSGSIMALWNAYAGLPDVEIVEGAPEILTFFQSTVLKVGQQYVPAIRASCPDATLPAPPSVDIQAQVIGRVEGLGILAHGVLQIIGMGAGGALDTLGAAASVATSPTTQNTIRIVAVSAAVLGAAYLALTFLPRRKRNPRRRRR